MFSVLSDSNPSSKLNPFPNKLWFLPGCSASLLKTLREKEKLLVTNNFSFFPHRVFYPLGQLSAIFTKFEIVIFKLFQFGRVLNLLFGKGLCWVFLYECVILSSFTIGPVRRLYDKKASP